MADPAERWHFQEHKETHTCEAADNIGHDETNSAITGLIAIDGSLRYKFRGGGALGWSAVMANENGDEIVSHSGRVPALLPVQLQVLRAELFAFLKCLQLAVPPLLVQTDCASVYRGLVNGEKWCVSAARPCADVWRRIWRYVDDISIGPHGVTLEKVKAHRSQSAINQLQGPAKAKARANALADARAKAGAEDDVQSVRYQTVEKARQDVRSMLLYMAAFLPGVRGDEGWIDANAPKYVAKQGWRLDFSQFPRHQLEMSYDDVGVPRSVCSCCGRSARTMAGRFRLLAAPCFGHSVERLPASNGSEWLITRGHTIMRTGSYYFCSKCGYHSSQRLHNLGEECRRMPANAQQRLRL